MALAGATDVMAKAAEVYKAANKVFFVNKGLPLPKSCLGVVIYRGNCPGEVQSAGPKDAPNFDLLERNSNFSKSEGKKYSKNRPSSANINYCARSFESFCPAPILTLQ
jgi:hypothetical protein